MLKHAENGGGWHGHRWRIAVWAVAALILLLPLVAMQFTGSIDWGIADFVYAGVLLVAAGIAYELLARNALHLAYRFAAGLALVTALILVWLSLGVGIIGRDGNPANLMYFGVIAVGLTGAIRARFQPRGLARALWATAVAQVVVAVIALAAGLGSDGPSWPLDLLALTACFVALFAGSALLFQKAARGEAASERAR